MAAALTAFIGQWIAATMPGTQALKIDRKSGRVQAKDALGWRDVGTFEDWLALGRALGVVKLKT